VWPDGLLRRRDRSERLGAAVRVLGGRAEDEARRDDEIRRMLERRRRRFAHLRDVLTDGDLTAFVVVLAAERLPVLESVELVRQLQGLRVAVGGLVVNRRSPADAGALLAERRAMEDRHLATLRAELPGVPVDEVPLLAGDLVGQEALERLGAALS
jgi:arsenite-transporting ATPase